MQARGVNVWIRLGLFALLWCLVESRHCRYVITNVTIVDVETDSTMPGYDVFFVRDETGELGDILEVSKFGDNVDFQGYRQIAGTGYYLLPLLIDSHTHVYHAISSDPTNANLASKMKGLSAAVSLGYSSDSASLADSVIEPFKMLRSGPLFVSEAYFEISNQDPKMFVPLPNDEAVIRDTINKHIAVDGFDLVQVLVDPLHPFDDATLRNIKIAVGTKAKIVAKIFDVDSADRAITHLTPDALSQTPIGALTTGMIDSWKGDQQPAIISTLTANSGVGKENLQRLHDNGFTVVYGTGSGETLSSLSGGISIRELQYLEDILGSKAAAYRAATYVPFDFWTNEQPSVFWQPNGGQFVNITGRDSGIEGSPNLAYFTMVKENPLETFDVFRSDKNRYYVSGEEFFCPYDCTTCTPEPTSESSGVDIDETYEIVIAVVVPIVYFGLIILLCIIGILYHFIIRRPRNKRQALEAEDWELTGDEEG